MSGSISDTIIRRPLHSPRFHVGIIVLQFWNGYFKLHNAVLDALLNEISGADKLVDQCRHERVKNAHKLDEVLPILRL